MNNNVQHPLNDFVHTLEPAFSPFVSLEKILIGLGYKSITDYQTAVSAKNVVNVDTLEFSKLGINVTSDPSDVIHQLRKLLKQYNIPFEMVHRRNGNFLKLVPPNNMLEQYIHRKGTLLERPKSKIIPNFDLIKYISGLTCDERISMGGSAFKQTKDYTVVHGEKTNLTSVYVTDDYIYAAMPCSTDGFYLGSCAVYNPKTSEVLRAYGSKDLIVQVGKYSYNPTSIDSAYYNFLSPTVGVYVRLPVNGKIKDAVANGEPLNVMIYYTCIYFDPIHRPIIYENNLFRPFYPTEHETELFPTGAIEVYCSNYAKLIGMEIHSVSVKGNHPELTLEINGAVIPIHVTMRDGWTVIKDFNSEYPLSLESIRRATISSNTNMLYIRYENRDPTVPAQGTVKFSNYSLEYNNGICRPIISDLPIFSFDFDQSKVFELDFTIVGQMMSGERELLQYIRSRPGFTGVNVKLLQYCPDEINSTFICLFSGVNVTKLQGYMHNKLGLSLKSFYAIYKHVTETPYQALVLDTVCGRMYQLQVSKN